MQLIAADLVGTKAAEMQFCSLPQKDRRYKQPRVNLFEQRRRSTSHAKIARPEEKTLESDIFGHL